MKCLLVVCLIALLSVLFCLNLALAEEDSINLKGGFMDILCDGADSGPIVELTYEIREEWIGAELGIGGTSNILHDTQVGTPWVGKNMGRLNMLDYFFNLKFYLPYNLYLGGGVGMYDTYFVENYRIYKPGQEADADDEIHFTGLVGWQFMDEWFLEVKAMRADLDIESNIFPEGILESHSRLDNWSVMIGRKFRL